MSVIITEAPDESGVYLISVSHKEKVITERVKGKSLAQKIGRGIERKLTDGDSGKPTFGDYAEKWVENYVKVMRKPSTYERYRGILNNHLLPVLKEREIVRIGRGELRNLFLEFHKQGMSESSVNLLRDVLSGVMRYAVDDEIISVSPVTGILKRLNLERKKGITITPMNPEEVSLILDTCMRLCPEYHPFFLCAFRTGMRLGELLALQWGDIDWHGHFIFVRKSFGRGKVSSTKTGKNRQIDMSAQLETVLRKLLTIREEEALKSGRSKVEIIFHRDGKHITQNYIRRVWKQILKEAGIRNMRIHDIRHTYASLLLSNRESMAYIRDQMGHSGIQMTIDNYGHLIPGSNREAVNRLDTL